MLATASRFDFLSRFLPGPELLLLVWRNEDVRVGMESPIGIFLGEMRCGMADLGDTLSVAIDRGLPHVLLGASTLLTMDIGESVTTFSSLTVVPSRYMRPLLFGGGGGVLAMICSTLDSGCKSDAPGGSGKSTVIGGLNVACEVTRLRLLRLGLLVNESDDLCVCLIQLSALCLFLPPFSFSFDRLENEELVREVIDAGRRCPFPLLANELGDGAAKLERPDGCREVRIVGGSAASLVSLSSYTESAGPYSTPKPGERATLGALELVPSDE